MTDAPRCGGGRAPDVFRQSAWVPMRCYSDADEVDFAIVGTGAGGGTLACRLAEAGFRVVAFDAGPFWRPLEDFASDETEQEKLYWSEPRLTAGDDAPQLGRNNSGRGVGGSTVHFTMVSLRFRPEWFRSRTALGYGHDWPVAPAAMERCYEVVEDALKIAGPVRYPWGRRRARYPYRAHEVNAAGLVLARGCESLGIGWAPTPLATLSAPRAAAPPCVYRGFCVIGCSTNAKQSVLVTWIPRALRAGAEIRDLAMVGRVAMSTHDRAAGVVYHRFGQWRMQKARHVVLAGCSIETPRLLFNSATPRFPNGLANSSGQVGRNVMVHSNDAVFGVMDEEIRWYKGPPSMAITEHWNYTDAGKDFHGGYCFLSQGPLPRGWARTVTAARGHWGLALRSEMMLYNRMAGFRMVGEVEPREENRVDVVDEEDSLGLPIPRLTFSYSDNDRRLIRHSIASMRATLEAAGARDLWTHADTAHLMGGCRMGGDPARSVTRSDGRTWDIPNLWVCDASLFPTGGGANPSLTIQ
ncbi:MAG: GMC oxidoreductase, partial [Longimicrobiales bacterium]